MGILGIARKLTTSASVEGTKAASPAVEYEARLSMSEQCTATTMTWFAAGSLLIAILAVAALLILLPLQKIIPMMVYVDKAGVNQVAEVVDRKVLIAKEEVARHFIARYVLSRERYLYQLLQDDYNFVVATTATTILPDYVAIYEGPKKKDAILGDRVEEKIKLVSVLLSPSTTGRATVRFSKETWATGSRSMQKTENFIADIAYDWVEVNGWNDTTLLVSPLGFKVTAYRVTPEYQ